MPWKERFLRAPFGARFKQCPSNEFPVSIWTAAEAARIGCCFLDYIILLPNSDD
jgi:hypothetical protein